MVDLAGEAIEWKCEDVRDELGDDVMESSSLSSGFFKTSAEKMEKEILV